MVHLSDLSVGSSDFQEALARRLLFLGSWVSHVEGSGEVSHSGEQVQSGPRRAERVAKIKRALCQLPREAKSQKRFLRDRKTNHIRIIKSQHGEI